MHMSLKMVLTGPYAGETIRLNGHDFVKGECTISGRAEALASAVTYLGRSYQAFPEGSDELAAAQARDEENGIAEAVRAKEEASGVRSADAESSGDSGVAESAAADSGDGDGPSGEAAQTEDVRGEQPAGAATGEEGVLSQGDGHENSGVDNSAAVEVNTALRSAVMKLDPQNDDHWTGAGRPKLAAVQAIYGANLTRAEMNAAVPDFTRESAREMSEL